MEEVKRKLYNAYTKEYYKNKGYKTIKLYKEDWELLRKVAFELKIPIMKALHEIIDLHRVSVGERPSYKITIPPGEE